MSQFVRTLRGLLPKRKPSVKMPTQNGILKTPMMKFRSLKRQAPLAGESLITPPPTPEEHVNPQHFRSLQQEIKELSAKFATLVKNLKENEAKQKSKNRRNFIVRVVSMIVVATAYYFSESKSPLTLPLAYGLLVFVISFAP